MWDLNFGTWISHRGFTVAFGHGHPLVPLTQLAKNIYHLTNHHIAFIKIMHTHWMILLK
jgi:hypothetical protein